MENVENVIDEVLKKSKKGFNPILKELNDSLKTPVTQLKILSFEKEVKIIDTIFQPNEVSDNSIFTSLTDSQISLVALIDGVKMVFNLNMDSFSDSSKLIDIIIGLNAFGESDNYSDDYKSSMLNFALGKVRIPTVTGYEIKVADSIVYLEANEKTTYIYYGNGERAESPQALGWFEAHFPKDMFIRISKMHLVNAEFIIFISKDGDSITIHSSLMKDSVDKKLPINRTYKALFADFVSRTF